MIQTALTAISGVALLLLVAIVLWMGFSSWDGFIALCFWTLFLWAVARRSRTPDSLED